jgi:hypothetical protein
MGNMISMEQTRTMIEAVKEIPPLPSFFKRTFFSGGTKTFITEDVDFDYKKGTRRLAPFVSPVVGGIPMERDGFETKTFTAPKISPERVITTANLKKRTMGEAVYSTKTPAQRALELQAEDYNFIDESISLTEEWMCRELMINGAILAKGYTNSGSHMEYSIDYKFTNREVLTGSDVWTDAGSDPIAQMVDWRRCIVAESGMSPNIILMRSETAMMLLRHPKFKESFDILRYNLGIIQPEIKEPLVTYYGRIPLVGADLYSYDATFKDPASGAETPFIPDNTVLFASTVTKGSMYYGAITIMDNAGAFQTIALPRVPVVLFDQDSAVRTLRVSSRPVPMPVNVDGWAVKVVA